jgi:hypothetical protein
VKTAERLKKGIDWRTMVMMRMNDENLKRPMAVEQ